MPRAGFVSILGRPNAGKSTLLNALLGEKLAIVARKPQTTRTTIQGVLHLPDAQIVFVDTPGIHESDTLINKRMMDAVRMAVEMAQEKLIDKKTALLRVSPAQLDELLHPAVDPEAEKKATIVAKGLPAGPGGRRERAGEAGVGARSARVARSGSGVSRLFTEPSSLMGRYPSAVFAQRVAERFPRLHLAA